MLSQLKIQEFIDILASKQPTPGGGSASALAGAVGIALLSMAANLTIGKKKYKQEDFIKQLLEEAVSIRESLISLIDEDTKAFDGVSAVFKMPKATECEKQKRRNALEEALKNATKVPYAIMEKTIEAIKLVRKSLGHTNVSTVSDTGVAAICLKAALSGAWLNVKINLNSIEDSAFVEDYGQRAQALLKEGSKIAEEIHDFVLNALQ
jgi:formiminotetrahydrofolate cyclodeaminase